MENQLYPLIMMHVDLLELSLKSTIAMIAHAKSKKSEKLIRESENRDRLLNIVARYQSKIEDTLNQNREQGITSTLSEVLNAWSLDFQKLIKLVNKHDQIIIQFLETEKNSAVSEISELHSFKERFRGYNLNDVKR